MDDIQVRVGIDDDNSKKILLIAMLKNDDVPIGVSRHWIENYPFIVLSTFPLPFNRGDSLHVMDAQWHSVFIPDIVAMSDLAISNLGYGIVSECVGGQTPLLYVPRNDFPEYEVLRSDMRNMSHSYLLPQGDFLDGKWHEYIKSCLSCSFDWQEIRTDGTEVASNLTYCWMAG